MRIRVATFAVSALCLAMETRLAHALPTSDEAPLSGASVQCGTTEGPVRGYWHKGTWHFRGIPYASAPVDALRWRAPLPPPTRGATVLDAGAWGPQCPQGPGLASPFTAVRQGEDCLNLNIWTPSVAEARPVMVWIHGGGFVGGTPVLTGTMGDTLAREHGVVVVSINYRLGALGFLVHPGLIGDDPARPNAAGNYGLLDQVRALEWVGDNIAGFGGDPANVTVFGESAGGISVLGLLASPLGDGLFHRAIVQSGPAWGDFEMRDLAEASVIGADFQARLGCADLACMRARSPAAVVDAYDVGPFGFLEAPDRAMLPVRDGHVFPQSILERFRAGEPKPGVPLLVGSNSLEGAMPHASLAMHRVSDWPRWAREHFGPAAGDVIEGLYLRGQYPQPSQAAGELLADAVFNCPTRRLIALAHAVGKRVYVYWFDYPTSLFPGALHGSDIPFVFRNVDGLPGSREYRASRSMALLWTNFARHGDPEGGTEERWEPWPASYLEIQKRLTPAQVKPGDGYMAWSDVAGWREETPDPVKTKDALCDVWDAQIEPLANRVAEGS